MATLGGWEEEGMKQIRATIRWRPNKSQKNGLSSSAISSQFRVISDFNKRLCLKVGGGGETGSPTRRKLASMVPKAMASPASQKQDAASR
jgi:hypothetical protein